MMNPPVLLTTLALYLALIIPAAGSPDISSTDTSNEEQTPICEKPVKARGPGNTIKSVAELKAIVIWSSLVKKKHGQKSANWHHAQNKSLKCKKSVGSHYYYCDLKANPCHYQRPVDNKDQSEQPPETQTVNEKKAKDPTP